MRRITGSTVVEDLFGAGKDGFRDGNKALGILATIVNAEIMNALQEEPLAVIEYAGLTPDVGDNTQLLQAIKIIAKGGDYKDSVRVASTAAINLAAPGANIDGVAMVAGDRFLEKDNATLANRGIYIWNGAAVPATRALDADTGAELNGGAIIPVEQGTANADTNWQITNDGVVTIGVTGLTFAQVGATQSSASIQGAFKNLKSSATGLSANVTVTADEIAVEDVANTYKTLRAVNLTISGAASGVANGLDTGALAINAWYSVWVIWNGTTTAGLISLSETAPTLPGGYTHKARVGWIRTDGTGNKFPLSFKQYGRRVQYVVFAGGNLTALPILSSGIQGSPLTPTWVAVAIGSVVPPSASSISVLLQIIGLAKQCAAAPNNSYGGSGSSTNPAPLMINVSNEGGGAVADFNVEGANVYYASDSATSGLFCFGFIDNI